MDNPASSAYSRDIAFVVDADNLRRLATILGEVSNTVQYTVEFSDGKSVIYEGMEDVIGKANSKEHAIVSLIAEATGEQGRLATVSLKKNASPSVEYKINGPQRDVDYFSEQFNDWVASVRQWYSLFLSSKGQFSGFGLALLGVAIFLPLYVWGHTAQFFFSDAVRSGKEHSWIQLTALIGMWTAEGFIFKLFPRGTFATGHGLARHKVIANIRNTVIVGFALSVIAGVAANWITSHF